MHVLHVNLHPPLSSMEIQKFHVLTSFKCSVCSTSTGIFNSISVESFNTAGVVGVRIEAVEDEAVHTAISSLKSGA